MKSHEKKHSAERLKEIRKNPDAKRGEKTIVASSSIHHAGEAAQEWVEYSDGTSEFLQDGKTISKFEELPSKLKDKRKRKK